mmetsp:Transcript_30091/g.73235  ORF Transcript_30091/g.73235 Transcript_30091/m.73235 type:complete len:285 (-) Transcript_30091:303-1157(-)
MALSHHNAAHCNQGRRSEAKFFRPEHGPFHDVQPCLELSVSLHGHPVTKTVEDESLMSLCKPELPWKPGRFDPGPFRGAGSSVVSGDENVVGFSLRYAGGNNPYAHLRHELHTDTRTRITVLQVVDKLRKILDGVNVVVRRRGDQTDTGCGVTHSRNLVVHFVPGKFSALSWFSALGHLDLDLVGVGEVVDGHSKSSRCNLLDCGVLFGSEAFDVLASFAGVALSLEEIHCFCKRLVGFEGDRSVRHGPCCEPLHNFTGRLDEIEWDLFAVNELVLIIEISLEL